MARVLPASLSAWLCLLPSCWPLFFLPKFLLCPSPLIECFRQSRSKHFYSKLILLAGKLGSIKEKDKLKILSFFWEKFSFKSWKLNCCHPVEGEYIANCFFPFLVYLLTLFPSISVPHPHLFSLAWLWFPTCARKVTGIHAGMKIFSPS